MSAYVVVLEMGGAVCGVFGPFSCELDAHRYAGPRNETQRGAMRGTVHQLREVEVPTRDPELDAPELGQAVFRGGPLSKPPSGSKP